jgi:hypothetical protein
VRVVIALKEANFSVQIFHTMATTSSLSNKVVNIESADQYNNIVSKQNQLVRSSPFESSLPKFKTNRGRHTIFIFEHC